MLNSLHILFPCIPVSGNKKEWEKRLTLWKAFLDLILEHQVYYVIDNFNENIRKYILKNLIEQQPFISLYTCGIVISVGCVVIW